MCVCFSLFFGGLFDLLFFLCVWVCCFLEDCFGGLWWGFLCGGFLMVGGIFCSQKICFGLDRMRDPYPQTPNVDITLISDFTQQLYVKQLLLFRYEFALTYCVVIIGSCC